MALDAQIKTALRLAVNFAGLTAYCLWQRGPACFHGCMIDPTCVEAPYFDWWNRAAFLFMSLTVGCLAAGVLMFWHGWRDSKSSGGLRLNGLF